MYLPCPVRSVEADIRKQKPNLVRFPVPPLVTFYGFCNFVSTYPAYTEACPDAYHSAVCFLRAFTFQQWAWELLVVGVLISPPPLCMLYPVLCSPFFLQHHPMYIWSQNWSGYCQYHRLETQTGNCG